MRLHSNILSLFLAGIFFTACLAVSSPADAKTVYKWKDKNGVIQYSDYPPTDNKKYDAVDVRGGTARTVQKDDTENSDTLNKDKANPADVPVYKENCNVAKQSLNVLNNSPLVSMDLNGDGENEVLTEDQRLEKIAEFEKLRDQYCIKKDDKTSRRKSRRERRSEAAESRG